MKIQKKSLTDGARDRTSSTQEPTKLLRSRFALLQRCLPVTQQPYLGGDNIRFFNQFLPTSFQGKNILASNCQPLIDSQAITRLMLGTPKVPISYFALFQVATANALVFFCLHVWENQAYFSNASFCPKLQSVLCQLA